MGLLSKLKSFFAFIGRLVTKLFFSKFSTQIKGASTMLPIDDNFESDTELSKKIVSTVTTLSEALQGSSKRSDKLIARGKIREIAQQFQQAAISYQEALREDAKSLEALSRLCLVSLKMGELHEGLILARSLIDRAPDYTFETITGARISSMAVLGDALRLQGETSSAAEAYKKSVDITHGEDVYSAVRFAAIKLDEGDMNAAMSTIEAVSGAGELSGILSTIQLLDNDPGRLPAITGVVSSAASQIIADMVA